MPPTTQVKLLRVLQEGEFERVGGAQTLKGDVRIIAASNVDLEAAVAAGASARICSTGSTSSTSPSRLSGSGGRIFRCWPLYFLDKFCLENKPDGHGVYPQMPAGFKNYDWPGNIRELQNVVERAVALTTGNMVHLEDLRTRFAGTTPRTIRLFCRWGPPWRKSERLAILQTLKKTHGDKELAARLLGIGLATLYRRLKEMEVKEPAPEDSKDG